MKTPAEILGITEPVELLNVRAYGNQIRIEYVGPTGVQVMTYSGDEALHIAKDLVDWANWTERH